MTSFSSTVAVGLVICLAVAGFSRPCDSTAAPLILSTSDVCDDVQKCYFGTECRGWFNERENKDDRGIAFRPCFFRCLNSVFEASRDEEASEGGKRTEWLAFMDGVERVNEWCYSNKRSNNLLKGDSGPVDSKNLKCVTKQIRNRACANWFPDK